MWISPFSLFLFDASSPCDNSGWMWVGAVDKSIHVSMADRLWPRAGRGLAVEEGVVVVAAGSPSSRPEVLQRHPCLLVFARMATL